MKGKRIAGLALAAMMIGSGVLAAGCGQHGGQSSVEIDETKTQLTIYNFDGGIGTEWLYKLAAEFESKYADVSFADNKMGVQVIITPGKSTELALSNSNYNIFFTEGVRFFSQISQNQFLNINDIVTESLSEMTDGKETGTIADKLSPEQKEALLAIDGQYYCLPGYETYDGIFYDKDVFEEYGLYFLDDGSFCETDAFVNGVYQGEGELAVGPDGIKNTTDDGMASSYEELFKQIDHMVKVGVVPFIWTGEYVDYLLKLVNGVWASVNGYDQMYQNFTFESTVGDEQVPMDVAYTFDANGNPVVTQEYITMETGYKATAQVGKYWGYKLLEKILSNSSNYSKKITGVLSHLDAQEEYIYSNLENAPIAMLVEGSYWYNEASGALARSENTYKDRAKNRRFAMLELPRQATGHVTEGNGTPNTLFDMLDSYVFINANIKNDAEKVAAAKAFLQYRYTDEKLQNFTCETGIYYGLNYEIPSERLNEMSPYGKSIVELRAKSKVARALGSNSLFMNNQTNFLHTFGSDTFKSVVDGATYMAPYSGIQAGISAKDYFLGSIVSSADWTKKYGDYLK